jgi:AcrR family transcriptional regulator
VIVGKAKAAASAAETDRPAGGKQGDARTRILAAAEQVFADAGYEGGSLRQVATKADVPLALVSYHFKGKSGLYRAVFEARSPSIVEQRMAGLALADLESDPRRKLEMIVKSVLVPMLRLRVSDQGRHFGMLLARESSDPSSAERGILRDFFDPVAHAVVDRLRAALPDRDEASLFWSYHSMIGAMVYVMADGGRMANVSGGATDPKNVADAIEQISQNVLHGLLGRKDYPGL